MPRPATRGWTRLQSRSTLSISGLPSEVLHRVAEVLDATHPRSLVAFAQTSKRLYAVASRILFSALKFAPLTDGKRLANDVEIWERILHRDGALQHVRRLILYWDGEDDGSIPDHHPYLSLKECERSDSDTNLETCWDLYYYGWCYETNSWIKDHEWEPLARLLNRLTGLADFFFVNPGPFPPQFLQILHERSSRCRLHHYTFRLGGSDMASIEADERSLIMSPCLSTIGNMNADRYCSLNKNQFAALLLARREAPSLRRVFAYWHGPQRQVIESHDAEDESTLPNPPALEYLQIFGLYNKNYQHYHSPREGSISTGDIDYEVLYDYTALRVLKLNLPMGDQTLPAPSNFPSLITFSAMCPDEPSNPAWSESFLALLRGLPSIKVLRVLGWPRSVSFTPGLNIQLQKLHLETRPVLGGPPLLEDHVLQLADMCPELEDLMIETKRSRGDAAEVARYRALGRLPRLRRLKLILDAAPPPIVPDDIVEVPARGQGPWKPYYPWPGHTEIEPWFEDGWDSEEASWYSGEVSCELKPHRNGHVRDVLVNSAIDSDLALSIFGVINSAKRGEMQSDFKHGIGVQPLERVEILANHGVSFPQSLPERQYPRFNGPVAAMLKAGLSLVNRHWVVERNVRDDSRDKIHVHEVGKAERIEEAENVADVGDYFREVWQRVWPTSPITDGGAAWWEQWESWPLDLDPTGKR